jgi:hypothetical protein
MNTFLIVVGTADHYIARVLGPYSSEHLLNKAAEGLGRNLNHDSYYIEQTEAESKDHAEEIIKKRLAAPPKKAKKAKRTRS